jgi:DHA1 family tetracycline resistance protein-like MFS transporter
MVPASIGGGILQPALNSLITKRVKKDDVGGMLGISAAFLSGANAVAPLLAGVLFQALGSTAPFLAGGILMAVLSGISMKTVRPGSEENALPGIAYGARA